MHTTCPTLPRIVAGYLECAQWADAPEGSGARFTHAARDVAAQVCAAFVEYIGPDLTAQAVDLQGPEQFGCDLWLTRCGHGAGFWDRDALQVPPAALPELKDRNGRPMPATERGATLGDILSVAAYGGAHISPFAYPDLCAYRGWLTFSDSAGFALTGGPCVWGFWQAWRAARPAVQGAAA